MAQKIKEVRILLISSSYPQSKSSYRGIFIHKIMKELHDLGCEVHVVTGVEAGKHVDSYQDVKIHQYNLAPVDLSDFRIMNLVSWIRYFFVMLSFSKKTAKKINPDIIHGCWAIPGGLIAYLVAKKLKKPVMVTFFGSGMRVGHKVPFVKNVLRYYLNRVDYMVSDDATEMFGYVDKIGVKNRKRLHIPAGTDVDYFRPKKELAEKYKGKRVLLLVGWFRKVRGQDFVLKCMPYILKEIPNAHVVFAGTGPTFDEEKQLAKKLGVYDNTDFLGNVDNKDLVELYNAADVVLLASDTCNYSTATFFEAASCGCAVVATDVKDTDIIVKNNETGLLAKYGDVQGFSSAVTTMLNDEKLRQKCRKNIRQLAVKNFSLKASAKKYLEIYKQLIK